MIRQKSSTSDDMFQRSFTYFSSLRRSDLNEPHLQYMSEETYVDEVNFLR